MNNPSPTPSPLVPQGSFLDQKIKSRARVKLAIYFAISINVIPLMALLIIGCRRGGSDDTGGGTAAATNSVAPTFTNSIVDTNPPPMTNITATPVVPAVTNTVPVVPAGPEVAAQQYKIASGDTFSSLAKKFGVKVKAIEDANPNVDPKKLHVGQVVQIPAPASSTSGAANMAGGTAAPDTGAPQTYTVKSGDTLTKIAHEFHVSVKSIESENSLTTTKIKVGDKLKIPAKAAADAAPAPSTPDATVPVTPSFSNPTAPATAMTNH